MKKLISGIVAGVLIAGGSAKAVTFGFENITDNGSLDVASQLTVDVTDAGNGQVLFTFNNVGPNAANITEIYFDDGTLLGIAAIQNGSGVNFSDGGGNGVNPGDLPSGNNVSPIFMATPEFSTESTGNSATGVATGETVGILFDLINGKAYTDTLAALADGSLRIGLHVRSIGTDGYSDSFVNNGSDGPPDNQVPDAASTVMLLGMALLGVEGMRRRMRR